VASQRVVAERTHDGKNNGESKKEKERGKTRIFIETKNGNKNQSHFWNCQCCYFCNQPHHLLHACFTITSVFQPFRKTTSRPHTQSTSTARRHTPSSTLALREGTHPAHWQSSTGREMRTLNYWAEERAPAETRAAESRAATRKRRPTTRACSTAQTAGARRPPPWTGRARLCVWGRKDEGVMGAQCG
jgi:hypothetical protein